MEWAKIDEEREQLQTERSMWLEERQRLTNIEEFKLQVERDKLKEEKEAMKMQKNIHGYTTANEILDLRVDGNRAAMQASLKSEGTQTASLSDSDSLGFEGLKERNIKGLDEKRDKFDVIQDMFDRKIHE